MSNYGKAPGSISSKGKLGMKNVPSN